MPAGLTEADQQAVADNEAGDRLPPFGLVGVDGDDAVFDGGLVLGSRLVADGGVEGPAAQVFTVKEG